MPYLPPSTVAESLRAIQQGKLVLPAIQREYVWRPAQATALFDSLLRGYPIGSLLSWHVEPDTAKQFRFYGFMKDFNELTQRHNPVLDLPDGQPITAVLDGQQRLTSLNIGLRGTFAWKRKFGWARFPENYPARILHLNLAAKAEENAAGLEYDFRFLTQAQLEAMSPDERRFWMPVPKVFDAAKIQGLMIEMSRREIANDQLAMEMVTDLWEKVHSSQTVYFYQETDQDIERVLDIFIRVNSAGTQLSYSDLLLSIATAQWKERDARQEIHELVDALNATGAGFRFTHDLVLKSGLVLSGVKDIRFKVKNFTVENMQRLNDEWDKIADALRVAVGLLHDFGLSGANVTARSILIPLATYVHHRGLTHAYREAPGEAWDRKALRDWTLRSLVIPGVWGSGLDSLLTALRETITRHGSRQFPSQEIERVMASRGKTLAVTPELVDTLLDRQYGETGTFAVLATLFPHVNTRNVHHVDHVFPSARLTRAELRKAGHPEDEVDAIFQCKDRLPNLQLLEGPENSSKSAKLPVHWLESAYPTGDVQQNYLALNALPTLPDSTAGFLDFYEARRELLRAQLTRTLGTGGEEAEDIEDADGVLPPIDEAIESESVSDDHLEAD